MSIEYEDRIIQERAEEEKMGRLRNRKYERKYRKRRLRLLKTKWWLIHWGHSAEGRDGKEYIKYNSRNGWVREMKRESRRKVRKEEDIPDGNGYKKYTDRWKLE